MKLITLKNNRAWIAKWLRQLTADHKPNDTGVGSGPKCQHKDLNPRFFIIFKFDNNLKIR